MPTLLSVRESFVRQFGEEEAQALEVAAESHKNGIHNEHGSDKFKWVICICIGHQCFEKDRYREHHGIKATFEDIKSWCIEEGELDTHDGAVDYIALLAGIYDGFMPIKEAGK